MFAFLSSLGVDGHTISPGYEYDAAKKDMVQRLGVRPEKFFLTRRSDRREVLQGRGVGAQVPDLRHAGLSGVSGRQTRSELQRLGDSHPQHPRLERALLLDDGRPLRLATQELLEKTDWTKLGVVKWRGARSALRKLHGALRLRADGQPRAAGQAGRYSGKPSSSTSERGPRRSSAEGVDAFNGVSCWQRAHDGEPEAAAGSSQLARPFCCSHAGLRLNRALPRTAVIS